MVNGMHHRAYGRRLMVYDRVGKVWGMVWHEVT